MERPEDYLKRRETIERLKEQNRIVSEWLLSHSEELKEKGFPVDKDCRIDITYFENTPNYKEIFSYHQKEVERESRKIKEQVEGSEAESAKHLTGELLEGLKTVALNKLWFNKRFICLRTVRYDDYRNGVDELIFDTKTKQPLAAVDSTTNVDVKDIKLKIQRGRIKYGLGIEKDDIQRKSYEDLPVFFIVIQSKDLVNLYQSIADKKREPLSENKLLDSLINQCEQYPLLVDMSPERKINYQSALKIFLETKQSI